MTARLIDRRRLLAGIGAASATVCIRPALEAALPEDRVRAVHYYSNAGDTQGRRGQPMVNQSTNVVVIETETGLTGIGEGGEPRTMEEAANMLIGIDPFRIDQHWQRMMRGYFYPDGSFMNW